MMFESAECVTGQFGEASDVVSFEARREVCKFRFSIENFELCKYYKKKNVFKTFKSSPFFSGGSGVEEIGWCIKLRLDNHYQKNSSSRLRVTCRLHKISNTPSNYANKTETFHIVGNNVDLVLKEGEFYYDDVMAYAGTRLPNGTLTLQCDLTLYYPATLTRGRQLFPGTTVLCESGLQDLQSHFRNLYTRQNNSDVVIRCGDQELQAHKLILSTRSSVFAKMFEHDTKENQESIVVIEDASAEAVKAMLRYFYCGEVENHTAVALYMQLYPLADRYDLNDLRSLCARAIAMDLSVDIVCDAASLAHLCNDEEFFAAVKLFFDGHLKEIVDSPAWADLNSRLGVLAERLHPSGGK